MTAPEAPVIVPLALDASAAVIEAAALLLTEYKAFVEAHAEPGFRMGRLEREIAALPASACGPGSALLLAFVAGHPAGCVAVRPADDAGEGTAELKRMWVRGPRRGRGVGEELVGAAARHAREMGYRSLVLDTEPAVMAEAIRLYLRCGFAECPAYRPAGPGIRFLRRAL
ncbi:hypothetical protein STVA_30810 [Allostella vacuolata]|nr:hypothetical protein STVA_30810 [Stella vacuolata]